MAAKLHPFGAIFEYDSDGLSTYTTAGDIFSIKPPNITVGASETTHLESTSGFREYIPGWGDGGEVTIGAYCHKTQWAALYAIIRTNYFFRIKWPLLSGESNASKWEFSGHITTFDHGDIAIDDNPIQGSITIKITAKPAFTAGT